MRRVWLALFTLLAGTPALQASTPAPGSSAVRYEILIALNPAGWQVTSREPDGAWRFEYEYNDRGRGPKIEMRTMLGAGGVPVSVEASGHDYFKSPVRESFSWEAGSASWKSSSEAGEKPVTAPAFYVSSTWAPEEMALLARALLQSPAGSLPLLPKGEARIERLAELQVHSDEASRRVVLYAVSGLALSPISIWLDLDGTFFASAGTWYSVVREGWQAAIPALLEAQEAAEKVWLESLAASLTHRPAGPLAFRGATVLDAEAAVERRGWTVLVEGDRIVAAGPDAEVPVPENAEVIEARGKTLLPGLWDMHVHVSREQGLLHLAAGVTSVRDLANDTDTLLDLRRQFDEGSILGPRVVIGGFLDGSGPYQGPTKVFADTPEQARAAVERYAELGIRHVKVYSSLKPELLPVVIEEAHRRGMRVSGHIPAFMTAEQAVRQGLDEIQHVNMLFLNFLADRVQDTRTPARFTAVAENAALLDLGSEPVRDFIELLKQRDVVVDPTVAVFEEMFLGRPGQVSPGYEAIAARLPPQVRRGLLQGGLPVPEGMDERYRASFEAMLAMVRLLHEAGVRMVAGTDAFAGFALHRELELYVRAGIPAARVLQMATLGAARLLGRDAELGSIAPGKLADLVLVDGEPIWNIPDIRKVELVLKDGKLFRSAELYRAVGIQP
jgi:imidazolonepropionase-like amidohydrolase